MQDNTKRGERTLFWMKTIFVIFILFLIWSLPIYTGSSISNDTLALSVLVRLVIGFLVSIGMFFSFFAFLVSFLLWLHRAIANLRILTLTDFSPLGAVLLTCVPFVGFIFHFLIFNDMAVRQQECMREYSILKEKFPKKFLVAWILISVIIIALMFVEIGDPESGVKNWLESILAVLSLGLYIKCFSFYIQQERELFRVHSEMLFRKRVDQIIREREIKRASD